MTQTTNAKCQNGQSTTNQKNNELTVEYEVNGQQVKLTPSIVQNYIVGTNAKITLQEFKFFTELCVARGLNPFLKEAYLIKYSDKQAAQLVVSKDVILKRAILHPQYDGKESGVIVQHEDGTIEERKGCFWNLNNEVLLGGWCRVYRKDWNHPEYMSVSLDEVAQKKDGELNFNWSTKTATMVEKVAKVRALREAFVDEFAGMYIEDEFAATEIKHEDTPVQEDPLDLEPTIVDVISNSQVDSEDMKKTFSRVGEVNINEL